MTKEQAIEYQERQVAKAKARLMNEIEQAMESFKLMLNAEEFMNRVVSYHARTIGENIARIAGEMEKEEDKLRLINDIFAQVK